VDCIIHPFKNGPRWSYCFRSSLNRDAWAASLVLSFSLSSSLLECRPVLAVISSSSVFSSSSVSSCCFNPSWMSCVSSTQTSLFLSPDSKGVDPGWKLSFESLPIKCRVVRTDSESAVNCDESSRVVIAWSLGVVMVDRVLLPTT